jgi:MFS family permease
MKLNVEKALKVCGNNNFYQKLLYIAVALTWFSVDFISISFPLLELEPHFKCKNDDIFIDCNSNDYCKLETGNRKVEIEYNNLITRFDLYCDTTIIISIGVLYTLGILIGSIISSHFSDVIGRKPVILISQFLFGLAAISMTISPNMYFVLVALFFTGFSSAGGTTVSFLYLLEILPPDKRSFYGTLINFSFAIAGGIYFTGFKYLKNWIFIAYMCVGANIIAFLMVSIYFLESPRFLISKGQYEKALKTLYKIAKKNGKSKDFYRYILSDMIYKKNSDASDYDKNAENALKNNKINSKSFISSSSNNDNIVNNLATKAMEINKLSFDKSSDTSEIIEKKDLDDNIDYSKPSAEIEDFINKLQLEDIRGNNEEDANNNEPLIMEGKSTNFESSKNTEEKKKEPGFLALIKFKSLRKKFLISCLLWFTMSFVYYGMSFFLKKDGGDIFLNGYVIYAAEGISYILTGVIMSISFIGRVKTLTIMFMLTAISSILFHFLNEIDPFYSKIPLFVSRFSITSIFSLMYTYSTEIYPTSIRAKGLGLNAFSAKIASVIIPITIELIARPFIIFSALTFFAFFFTFFLPETINKELEDEIFEERLKSKKISISTN